MNLHIENIYKMYKKKAVTVLQMISYHGLHTESKVSGGAAGDR